MKAIITSVSLLLLGSSLAQTCMEVVGYYPNWQWYDRNKLVNPASIDYSKYTIINYAFLKPESNGSISLIDPWADENLLLGQIDWASGGYIPNTSLIDQAHSNNVKVLPSIGGWTLSDNFPGIAADPAKRSTFAQACVNLIQTYNFDGIDLDWEYPGFVDHGGSPQDMLNFTLLLQEVRAALDAYAQATNSPMLLTAAVGASSSHMDDVDWAAVSNSLDIINLMSYDYFGTWDPITNHNAPLYAPAQGDPEFNLASSVERLINTYGVDPQKITVGIPFYGRSAVTTATPGLHVPSTGTADNIVFAVDEGTPLYYTIVQNMAQFTEHWDNQAQVPYLIGNSIPTFVSFDNPESVELKAQHIVDKGLRGAIIWEITGDYLETSPGSGQIASTPLADKINDVFCNYVPSGGGSSTIAEVSKNDISIYPNPSNNFLHIASSASIKFLELVDVTGHVIATIQGHPKTIDLSSISSGSYLLVCHFSNGQVARKSIQRQ